MPSLDWQVAAEIATTVSTIAMAASAVVVVMQLRQAARERYFSVTAHLFEIWQSPEFQHDQLFLLHKLSSRSWEDFCALGRGEHPERAVHRVGGYYDRVGNLVRHGLIRKDDILPTIGGYAVAVWHRIEPLVKELRLRENAVLFENYEALLPECRECYVPGLEAHGSAAADRAPICAIPEPAPRIQQIANPQMALRPPPASNGHAVAPNFPPNLPKSVTPMTIASTQSPTSSIPEISLPDSDGVMHSVGEFTAAGPAVLVYARGAWCPFCLRQLADYGERYRDFRQAGIEVFAVSPESPRRSRRMRTQLKLPFPILSDSHHQLANNFGLMNHEKQGQPTPATLVLDPARGVLLSTLNDWEKALLARDVLDYTRAIKEESGQRSIPPPVVQKPKPGLLGLRAVWNIAAGLVIR